MSSDTARTSVVHGQRGRALGKVGAGSSVLLWLFALGAGCDSQATVVQQICCGLTICTGVDVPDCEKRIEDGLLDHRLSRTGVARCADCIANNVALGSACSVKEAGCPTILDERDCDQACKELDVALNARTSSLERAHACDTVVVSCSVESKQEDACGFDALLKADATRAVDLDIDTCAECINDVACPSDTSGGGAPNFCDDHANGLDLPFCSALIERCSSACSKLAKVAGELSGAGAALAVCRRGVEACVRAEGEEANEAAADALAELRRQNLELAPFLGKLVTTERNGFGGAGGASDRHKSAAFERFGGAGGRDDDGGGNGGAGGRIDSGGVGGEGGAGTDGPIVVPELDDCYRDLLRHPLDENFADAERAVLIEGCSACLEAAPLCDDIYNCAECRALYPTDAETSTLEGREP